MFVRKEFGIEEKHFIMKLSFQNGKIQVLIFFFIFAFIQFIEFLYKLIKIY